MEFYVSDYVRANYLPNFGPFQFPNIPENAEVPYAGVSIAYKRQDGTMVSLLVMDNSVPYESSMAKKLIADSRAGVSRRASMMKVEDPDVFEDIVTYTLPLHNPESSIFKPTLHESVSGCINTEYEFTMELVFNLGDGLLLPVKKVCKGAGAYALNFADWVHSVLSDFDDHSMEAINAFFEECPNAVYDADNEVWRIICSSAEGLVTDIECDISDPNEVRTWWSEIIQGLCSIRIVEFTETIISKK